MDQDLELVDPFTIPDLSRNSIFSAIDGNASQLSPFSLPTIPHALEIRPCANLSLAAQNGIIDTQPLNPDFQEDDNDPDTTSVSSAPKLAEVRQDFGEDVWAFTPSRQNSCPYVHLNSWEAFQDTSISQSRATYLSDVNVEVFDAVLEKQGGIAGRIIQTKTLLSCLVQLGLGRGSVLYAYDHGQQSFVSTIEQESMSGYTVHSFSCISRAMIEHGNAIRNLRSLTEKYRGKQCLSASATAIMYEIEIVFAMIEALVTSASANVRTLLQLEKIFEVPRRLVTWLSSLMSVTISADSDVALLSEVFSVVQQTEDDDIWIQQVISKALSAAVSPWQAVIEGWLRLSTQSHPYAWSSEWPSFVKYSVDHPNNDDFGDLDDGHWTFKAAGLPKFLSEDDGRLLFETGQALRLIEKHQPTHPLVRRGRLQVHAWPGLDWNLSWRGAEAIARQAKEYEEAVVKAMTDYQTGQVTNRSHFILQQKEVPPPFISQEGVHMSLPESIASLEAPILGYEVALSSENASHWEIDEAQNHLNRSPKAEGFGPPLAMMATLCWYPWVSAQNRLANRACVQMLFEKFNFRAHFNLLNRYHLLGDPAFTSRLCHALFDPDLQWSGHKRARHGASASSLQLGHRDSWPPASSELRLALTGILTDSYSQSEDGERASAFCRDLPGGLSFAIRAMSEAESQRCLDPNSIFALDFLQLQYRPPSPLGVVITSEAMIKYDAIFQLSLRVQRMLFITDRVGHCTRASKSSMTPGVVYWLRLRQMSHHFVCSISSYFFNGIAEHCACLNSKLSCIGESLSRKDDAFGHSVWALRDYHGELLDRTLLMMFLDKRQEEVMELLEEIFGIILRFASFSQNDAISQAQGELHEMCENSQKKITDFVRMCRSLTEKTGPGGTKATNNTNESGKASNLNGTGTNTIGHLLLLLETNGFYR